MYPCYYIAPTVSALCLSASVVLLHDNTRPYSVFYTAKTLQPRKFQVSERPVYGTDLAPFD